LLHEVRPREKRLICRLPVLILRALDLVKRNLGLAVIPEIGGEKVWIDGKLAAGRRRGAFIRCRTRFGGRRRFARE